MYLCGFDSEDRECGVGVGVNATSVYYNGNRNLVGEEGSCRCYERQTHYVVRNTRLFMMCVYFQQNTKRETKERKVSR